MLLPSDVPPMNMGEKGGSVHRINAADAVYVGQDDARISDGGTAVIVRLARYGRWRAARKVRAKPNRLGRPVRVTFDRRARALVTTAYLLIASVPGE